MAAHVRAGLAAGPSPQAVLVSGESGSGKTEAVRVLLGCLAGASPVATRLLNANLVLEALYVF